MYASTSGKLTVYHYDLCSQALARVERGHDRDLADVVAMIRRRAEEAFGGGEVAG